MTDWLAGRYIPLPADAFLREAPSQLRCETGKTFWIYAQFTVVLSGESHHPYRTGNHLASTEASPPGRPYRIRSRHRRRASTRHGLLLRRRKSLSLGFETVLSSFQEEIR